MDWHIPLFTAHASFWAPTLTLTGVYGVRYLTFAGIAYALGYRRGIALRWNKLQPAMPSATQVLREIGYSAVAVLVFGAINGVLFALGVLPHTMLYLDIAQYGWTWFALSIVAALFLHDTYFYWTHRLLHLRPVFRAVHRVHHLSTNPTPWTAYAFHPSESVVQAGAVVLIIFTMPIHPLAIIVFQVISTAINVYGHSGYELYPAEWPRHWLGRWINTSVAHNTHHAIARHNYGLYFLFWDRWMGTLDPEYERRYRLSRPRRAEPKGSAESAA
jgi:Delta7-sterol 5-desaturase